MAVSEPEPEVALSSVGGMWRRIVWRLFQIVALKSRFFISGYLLKKHTPEIRDKVTKYLME